MGTKFEKLNSVIVFVVLLFANLANASPENDRVYQLDTVAWLKASDNTDGVFADYLDDQYLRYFSKQSRFVVKRLKGLDEVIGSSSEKYAELVQQAPILKKISQKFRIENLIRSRVYKENDTYRFVLEWVYAPRADVLAKTEFRYVDPGRDEGLEKSELPVAIQKGLDELIEKLPFVGQITGIDGSTLTASVGRDQDVKKGDVLAIATLQSVRRHPLLKTIEEWRWQEVGKAEVDQVEESLSFAHMIETEPGQHVVRFQKVKEILETPTVEPKSDAPARAEIPKLGWVAGNIGIGNYARDVGLPGNNSGRTGGGLLQSFEIDSQVWMNSRFIAQASLMGTSFKYNPKDLSAGTELPGSYSGSGNQFRLAAGYSFFPMKTIFDSIAWATLGYKSTHYSLPASTDFTGNSEFGSLFIGLGGQLALADGIGAQLGIDLGLIRGASQKNLSFGDASASTDLGFNLAGTYRYSPRLSLRLLLKLNSQSMDFAGGESVTQKMFSVSPSVMYYF